MPITENYLVLKVTWGPFRFKLTRNGMERELRQSRLAPGDVDAIMQAVDYAYQRYMERHGGSPV